jgi:hypothetical protein
MDFDTFVQAVNSLNGFTGIVGIMGGEPTLIPDFEKYVEYFANTIKLKQRRGLWSSLGESYYKHYELIKDVFGYECLNDHKSPSLHQPLLVASKELPIDENTRKQLIDKCWIQTLWSSSITPKGCFFCEVAAALDRLFDGPGGWPIKNHWHLKQPKDFGDQLKWCDLCGGAMPLPRRNANDKIDDISPGNYKRLCELGSPKISKNQFEIFDINSYDLQDKKQSWHPNNSWYLAGPRIKNTDELKPKKIEAVIVCVNYDDYLAITLPRHINLFDNLVVVTSTEDVKTQELCTEMGVKCIVTDSFYDNSAMFNKGKAINQGLQALDLSDWVLFLDADILLPKDFRYLINKQDLNPGNLYYTKRVNARNNNDDVVRYLQDETISSNWNMFNEFVDESPHGYFQLVNKNASIVKSLGKNWYPDIFKSAGECDEQFCKIWPLHKQVLLSDSFKVVHLPHGYNRGVNWFGRKSDRFSLDLNLKDINEI